MTHSPGSPPTYPTPARKLGPKRSHETWGSHYEQGEDPNFNLISHNDDYLQIVPKPTNYFPNLVTQN